MNETEKGVRLVIPPDQLPNIFSRHRGPGDDGRVERRHRLGVLVVVRAPWPPLRCPDPVSQSRQAGMGRTARLV